MLKSKPYPLKQISLPRERYYSGKALEKNLSAISNLDKNEQHGKIFLPKVNLQADNSK